jgi:hypothetical protein
MTKGEIVSDIDIHPFAIPRENTATRPSRKFCPFLHWYFGGEDGELNVACTFGARDVNNEENPEAEWTEGCKFALRNKVCKTIYPNGSKPFTPTPA